MIQIPFIDLKRQYKLLKSDIDNRIMKVLDHGQYIMGPEVRELEDRLSIFTQSKYCITVSSGTEALLISLMALKVGPGDEVITTPFSFISVAEVVTLLGARPIYVDIELETGNINSELIEAAINKNTKAIIPVSLYGQPSDMDEINSIAEKYNITVIEDAAQSFGSEYKGKKSCNLSRIGCTSFFPSKPLGCYGDGGAIFTNDDSIAQLCREIRIHGQSKRYEYTNVGVGGRMDTLQCAILLSKLEKFDWEIRRRIELGKYYNELIDKYSIPRIKQKSDRNSVFAQYTILVEERELCQSKLAELGIPTAVHYPTPINRQRIYRHTDSEYPTPITDLAASKVLSLPMSPYIEKSEIENICAAVGSIVNHNRK